MAFSSRIALIIVLIPIAHLVFFSSPCPAKTTITVQIAYGGVICGGVGLCLYFYYSLGSGLWSPDILPAIVYIRGGKIALGIPAIECEQPVPEISHDRAMESYSVRFLRWEF
jgi:hypothetical protein